MKLEPIIQSEVSQKYKDRYNILTHIYGIRNMLTITLYAEESSGFDYRDTLSIMSDTVVVL